MPVDRSSHSERGLPKRTIASFRFPPCSSIDNSLHQRDHYQYCSTEHGGTQDQLSCPAYIVVASLPPLSKRRPYFHYAAVCRRTAESDFQCAGAGCHHGTRIGTGPGRRLALPAVPGATRLAEQR